MPCTFFRAAVTMSNVSGSEGAAATHTRQGVLARNHLLAVPRHRPCQRVQRFKIRITSTQLSINAQAYPGASYPCSPSSEPAPHLEERPRQHSSAPQVDVMHLAAI